MPLFGSHLSIAGGYYKAADAAAVLGMDTVQIFTKNNNQWSGKALSDEDVRQFKEAVQRAGLKRTCSHDSYLINLGSPTDELWNKSVDAFAIELERAEALGLAGVVMHPGSHLDSTPEEGLARIVKGLDEVHRRTKGIQTETWLETTAGQGTNLGYRFEQIGYILSAARDAKRMGVCVDTCHIFAAGYGLKTQAEYEETMGLFDEQIGFDKLRAVHLNDSKKGQGSRVDRHDHIGEGMIGLEAFRVLLNDKRFAEIPMYLETKKEKRDGEEMDAVNLRVLKGLLKPQRGKKS